MGWNTNLCLAGPNSETAATTRNVLGFFPHLWRWKICSNRTLTLFQTDYFAPGRAFCNTSCVSSEYENIQVLCWKQTSIVAVENTRIKKNDIINPEWFIQLAGSPKHHKKKTEQQPTFKCFSGNKMHSGTEVLKHEWAIWTKHNTFMKGFNLSSNKSTTYTAAFILSLLCATLFFNSWLYKLEWIDWEPQWLCNTLRKGGGQRDTLQP